jgi:hypothetical protein
MQCIDGWPTPLAMRACMDKVERKLFDLFAKKLKWNGNMKTKTEFCGKETETEFFRRKKNGIAFSNERTRK